jgi:P-type Cu+ transporter
MSTASISTITSNDDAHEDACRIDLPVEGMTCAACVRRIERALQATDGIHEAKVNLVTRTATVTFNARKTTRATLVAAIEKAGYSVPASTSIDDARVAPAERARAADESLDKESRTLMRDFIVALNASIPLLACRTVGSLAPMARAGVIYSSLSLPSSWLVLAAGFSV